MQEKLAKLKSKGGYQESDLVNYVRKAATISKNIDNELDAKHEQLDEEDQGTEGNSYSRSADPIKSADQFKLKSPSYGVHDDQDWHSEGTITKYIL